MGAISVRKVRGEVNPADLFTKHLPSREKVHQLMGLFGCEYRSGRAEAAPLLRPMCSDSQQADHLNDVYPLPNFLCAEGEIHDESRLPHLYAECEIESHFPLITAASEMLNTKDWNVGDEKMDAREEYEAPGIRRGGDRQKKQTSAAPARRVDPHRK